MNKSEGQIVGVLGVVGVVGVLGQKPGANVSQDYRPQISHVSAKRVPQLTGAEQLKQRSTETRKRASRNQFKEKEIRSLQDSLSGLFETSTSHRPRKPPGSYASLQAGRPSNTVEDGMLASSTQSRNSLARIAPRPTKKEIIQEMTECVSAGFSSLPPVQKCSFRKPPKKVSPKVSTFRSKAAAKGWRKRRAGDTSLKIGQDSVLPVVSQQEIGVSLSPIVTQQQVLPNISTLVHNSTTANVENYQDWTLSQDDAMSSQNHELGGLATERLYNYGQDHPYIHHLMYDVPNAGPVHHEPQPASTLGQLYGNNSYPSPAIYPDTTSYFDLDTNRGNMNLDRLLWDMAVNSSQYNPTTGCWELGTAAAALTTYFALHDAMMEAHWTAGHTGQQDVVEAQSTQPPQLMPNPVDVGSEETFIESPDQLKQYPSVFGNSQQPESMYSYLPF